MSLVEVLVAAVAASLVVSLALGFHESARRSFHAIDDAVEQQHVARVALDLVESDLGLAGFHVNPDGDPSRPDEAIEVAAATAMVVRGDFDSLDPAAAADPEWSLGGGRFDHVTTGNDEIRGFVLRPASGRGSDVLTFDADVVPAPRDGVSERVTIDGIALTLGAPPYTLYRVALDADPAAYGRASSVRFTPLVDNVSSLRFRYFDRDGTIIPPPDGVETEDGRLARAAIWRVGIEIEVLSRDPDPRPWRRRTLGLESQVLLRNASTLGARPRRRRRRRTPSRGVALVLVLCVLAATSVLAISVAFLADTDRRIARNELRIAQARYVAESGARVARRWFDDPRWVVPRPEAEAVDRSLRRIRNEADPYGATIGSSPAYKQDVDVDRDGRDDLFDPPFDGSLVDAFRGTVDGPDLRIDRASPTGEAFLDSLSERLFEGFPGEGGGVRARITRIDVSSPPYLRAGGGWVREGIATLRVTARIELDAQEEVRVLAERTAETVLTTVAYGRVLGPVHSCAATVWTGRVAIHWGTMASVGPVVVSSPGALAESVPRSVPGSLAVDPFWNTTDPAVFDAFLAAIEDQPIPDPWFRILSGSDIEGIGATPGAPQPFPPAPVPSGPDRSNLFQRHTEIGCPDYDYATWRAIARSGDRGTHYFVWNGNAFREDGTGSPTTMADAVREASGIYFFDTSDGAPPRDADGDGVPDNLTPDAELDGALGFRGVLYAHASSIRLVASPAPGSGAVVRPPGEPFQDLDADGAYDPGERHLDLAYPTSASDVASPILAAAPGGTRDRRGPTIPDMPPSFHGILFNRGRFDATGSGLVYGAVVAVSGIGQSPADGSAETPEVFWDASIPNDWPPPDWPLPRVAVHGERVDP